VNYTVHIPGSKATSTALDGQGQTHLDRKRCKTNRDEWNLSRRMSNQSEITQRVRNFKLFTSAGSADIIYTPVQQRSELLVQHHVTHSESAMAWYR
jgi:hypothetical protein